jgi:putative ribosome biogenesis GTPase RsgA
MQEERICKYEKCRHEAEDGSEYCKYHVKMVEIENRMPPKLKELYEKMKKERSLEDKYMMLKNAPKSKY